MGALEEVLEENRRLRAELDRRIVDEAVRDSVAGVPAAAREVLGEIL